MRNDEPVQRLTQRYVSLFLLCFSRDDSALLAETAEKERRSGVQVVPSEKVVASAFADDKRWVKHVIASLPPSL